MYYFSVRQDFQSHVLSFCGQARLFLFVSLKSKHKQEIFLSAQSALNGKFCCFLLAADFRGVWLEATPTHVTTDISFQLTVIFTKYKTAPIIKEWKKGNGRTTEITDRFDQILTRVNWGLAENLSSAVIIFVDSRTL